MTIALIAAGLAGCAPSLRWVHRGNVYFERCYAADLDPHVPIEERRRCWQGWIAHYQVGQTQDRLGYVRERILRLDPERAAIVALATGSGDGDPVPLTDTAPQIAGEAALVTAVAAGDPAPAEEAAPPIAATEEVAIEAPPPPPSPEVRVAREPDRAEAQPIGEPPRAPRNVTPARERLANRRAPLPATETPHCAATCGPVWDACAQDCVGDARSACIRACRLRFRACTRGCY